MTNAHKSARLHGFNHLDLIEVELRSIRVPDRELRTHSREQIRKISKSLEVFGWITPILITPDRELIAGAARVRAGQELGLTSAPAVRVDHLSPEEVRLYRIADNRLAEEADWNRKALRVEIEELLDLEIDIELTGFDVGEIDVLLDESGDQDGDVLPPEPPDTPVSGPGEVWRIGDHILICGDALAAETYQSLNGLQADAVFTDPPYNVKVENNVSGLGKAKHSDFVQASGEMSPEEFAEFLENAHARMADHVRAGAVIFSCMDWRSVASLVTAGQDAGLELINMAVWDKGVGGMGALYRSQHELVAVFKKPGAAHRNNVALGRHGRNRTNVWAYAGLNSGCKERDALLALHPTVKPQALVADAIKDVTKHGDVVLDPFGGSGTTMLAAQETGRRAVLIERDPKYVDVIIRRMEQACGLIARNDQTGLTLDETAAKAEPDIEPATEKPAGPG